MSYAMAKRKVLVQWVGHSELRALAASLSVAKRKKVLDVIKGDLAMYKKKQAAQGENFFIQSRYLMWGGRAPVIEQNIPNYIYSREPRFPTTIKTLCALQEYQ